MKFEPKEFITVKAVVVLSVINVILLIFVPVLMQYGYVQTAVPETLVGAEGLVQLHAYLIRFNIATVVRIVLEIPFMIFCVTATVQSIKEHRSILHIMGMPLMVLTMVLFQEPQRSHVDVQGKQFSDIPTIHAFQLLVAVEKDMKAEPVERYSSVTLLAEQNDYSYETHSRHSSRKHYVMEYSLTTLNHTAVCQLSASDYNELLPYVGEYTSHKVMIYPNSGLLYSLDDGEPSQTNAEAEADYYADQYTLTYDEDGYLRWTPEGLYLSLVIQVDGEEHQNLDASGKSEYKLYVYEGHETTAYLTQRIFGKHKAIRVSNIITVTEPNIQETTEYVPPTFTGKMTDNGDSTKHCTIQPYGISVDLPETLHPYFLEEETYIGDDCAELHLLYGASDAMEMGILWRYTPQLTSAAETLTSVAKSVYQDRYEGCGITFEPLEGFDDACTMLVTPGKSDLPRNFLYAAVKVGAGEYLHICIAYADKKQAAAARKIVDSIVVS